MRHRPPGNGFRRVRPVAKKRLLASSCQSVRPSVRMYKSGCHCANVNYICYCGGGLKSVDKFQIWLKLNTLHEDRGVPYLCRLHQFVQHTAVFLAVTRSSTMHNSASKPATMHILIPLGNICSAASKPLSHKDFFYTKKAPPIVSVGRNTHSRTTST